MKQLDANNQSIIAETLPAQSGQALATTTLNDLPVNEAQAAEVKGGIVTIEYLMLAAVPPSPVRR